MMSDNHDEATLILNALTAQLTDHGMPHDKALNLAQHIYEVIQRDYKSAGAPYGTTDLGLLRWIAEQTACETVLSA